MKRLQPNFEQVFLAEALHSLRKHHLPRILRCLEKLSEKQIWWRPNPASNSAGNLVLHLNGNVRQWILSGLGGLPDRRERDREFSERGPLPRRVLAAKLRKTVNEACRVIARLTPQDLARLHAIQRYQVSGFVALSHVTEHFAHHSGQILYITKMLQARDLGFTHLPGEKRKRAAKKRLPAI
jgi:uncharacterized damage-inducible protein DinB